MALTIAMVVIGFLCKRQMEIFTSAALQTAALLVLQGLLSSEHVAIASCLLLPQQFSFWALVFLLSVKILVARSTYTDFYLEDLVQSFQ